MCINNQVNYIKPQIDVVTRFDSTYEMLECALKIKIPLTIMETTDTNISEGE